jgi:copper homeostasis protein
MIRPRSGNFVYSDEEFELMLIEMEKFKAAGADGFVSGFLNENATVNILQTRAFVNACAPLPVTFHRAIDECVDYNAAVANVVDCGVKRILSTGTAPSAFLGKQMLNEVQKKYSDQLIVVAGGSVRSAGLSDFLNNSVISEVHSAAIMKAGSDVVNAEELNDLIRLANVF